jgi:hypothetical protein
MFMIIYFYNTSTFPALLHSMTLLFNGAGLEEWIL